MTAGRASAVKGAFADVSLSLFRAAVTTGGGAAPNFVLSPYSIISALGMTALGAKGATQDAFVKLLGGMPAETAARLTAVDAALKRAVAAGADVSGEGRKLDATSFNQANTLYLQLSYPSHQAFLDALATGYGAGVHLADFVRHSEAARAEINDWVSGTTNGLIPQLLSPGAIDSTTRLVLVNALYLKAAWASDFEPSASSDFTTSAGSKVEAVSIEVTADFAFAKGTHWRSTSLPYAGNGLSFTIILPDAGQFDDVLSSFDERLMSAALSGKAGPVHVRMPTFFTDSERDLIGVLQRIGATALFDNADFSGMAGEPGDLYIQSISHAAKISVDEHGTEAAAATAVVMGMSSAAGPPVHPREFIVDRPFFYVIADTATQTPLFMGMVGDPTATG